MESEPTMMDLIRSLYPICRSITGNGVRDTLAQLEEWLPLDITEVDSGTQVFDWVVPKEWNIRDAYIANTDGERVVDFRSSNLHVVNYSVPVNKRVDRRTLANHLHSIPEQPELIPYRTSYYAETWGFCVSQNQRETLLDDEYDVCIDSSLENGSLTYGEAVFPGESEREFVIYTHTCHPSLANDNLAGIAVAAAVGRRFASVEGRRLTLRVIFGPGTIGSLTWLSRNQDRLGLIDYGLVIGLLGDVAPLTYKRTRDHCEEVDQIAEYVLDRHSEPHNFIDFSPYGYDERQFGSPGINLPFGRLTRAVNAGYPEYHTSGDNIDIISDRKLADSLEVVCKILNVADMNQTYVNRQPFGEPQLGRRGLYRSTGGTNIPHRESAMLWILNQSDGNHSLLDIAIRSKLDIETLANITEELVGAGLLEAVARERVDNI